MSSQSVVTDNPVHLNGVNVEKVHELVDAIVDQPELAKSKFRLKNRWINGAHNQSNVTGFYSANQE
ncbi:MAG: OsmC family protein, partial [Desulfobulbia bacterium]